MTLSPAVFGLICLAYYNVQLLGQPFYRQFSGFRHTAAANALKAFLFFITLSYPAVCRTVLLLFKTKEINGTDYLEADMRYTTDDPSHPFFSAYASLMMLVYPIGVPLTLLFMIRGKVQRQTDVSTQNDEIEENAPSTVCCGRFSVNALDDASEFLMSGIESECWYYEVTELVRQPFCCHPSSYSFTRELSCRLRLRCWCVLAS